MKPYAVAALLFALFSSPAFAAEAAAPATAPAAAPPAASPRPAAGSRRERMANCKMQADDKKLQGTERKQFMSGCAKSAGKPMGHAANREKMAACRKQADDKQLQGNERKKFVRDCVKNQ